MNLKVRSIISQLFVFVFIILSTQAATYYVATNGSDSNPGTQNAPFATLVKGAAAAQNPGDTVIVGNGTYGNNGVTAPNYVITLNHSGSSGNPITLKAQNRGQAILDSGNTSTGTSCNGASAYFNLSNASFVVIEGFVIQHSCDSGFQSNDNAHDITIRWNTIQYIANRTITDQYGRDGIYLNNNEYNFLFDGNVFHDIGRTGGVSLPQFDHGIYTHAANVTIMNNVFYNMNRGYSIQLADGASNYLIANNTFAFGDADGQPGQVMYWGGLSNITNENNIYYEPNGAPTIQYAASISNSTFAHNLVYGVSSIMANGTGGLSVGTNMIGQNPLFVNATTAPYNFALQPGSPAIGAGVTLSQVTDDITGASRAQGAALDLGAYAFAGVAAVPTTFSVSASPSAVSVTQGQTAAGSVSASMLTGSATGVSFAVTGQPAGVTATVASASCTASPSCSDALNIAATSSAAPGNYTLTVTGSGAGASASATIALTVAAASTSSTGTGTTSGGSPSNGAAPPSGGSATNGLVAWWKLNETSGTTLHDSSGAGNNATDPASYWWTSVHGPCLYLNGNGWGTVNESASLEMTSQLSVSMWIDVNQTSNTDPRVISKLYDWDIKLNGNAHPQFDSGNGQYAEMAATLAPLTWHHLVFTFNNGVVTGYLDGKIVPFLSNTFSGSSTLPGNKYGLLLGTDPSQQDTFVGNLAGVRLYNRVLSEADVATLFQLNN